jgi:hypothetical protein
MDAAGGLSIRAGSTKLHGTLTHRSSLPMARFDEKRRLSDTRPMCEVARAGWDYHRGHQSRRIECLNT